MRGRRHIYKTANHNQECPFSLSSGTVFTHTGLGYSIQFFFFRLDIFPTGVSYFFPSFFFSSSPFFSQHSVDLFLIMVVQRLIPSASRSAYHVARRSMASAAAATGTIRYVQSTLFFRKQATFQNFKTCRQLSALLQHTT